MAMIIGMDGGNKNVNIFGKHGGLMFNSELGEYRERNLRDEFSKDDIVYEFNGVKGFAGTLATFESQFSSSMMGDSKAHDEFLIRVLLGLHRYTDDTNEFKIVVGQPISKHNAKEKLKIKSLLEGSHTITVNDVTKEIHIERVEVAAEGGAAFWASPRQGKVHIMDFGSGTVNCATLIDGRYVDRDSFTLADGMNTLLNGDVKGLVRQVCIVALKRRWDIDDEVVLVGGGAPDVRHLVSEYFDNVSVLYPINKYSKSIEPGGNTLHPVYANAVGNYEIGKRLFRDGR